MQTEEFFSTLMRVMDLARDEHVKEMVDLLRQHGAKYGTEARKRYQERCRSDRTDSIYVREFHKSATICFVEPSTASANSTGHLSRASHLTIFRGDNNCLC